MQKVMINKAIELLTNGTVQKVIGWQKGEFAYDITPAVFETAEEIEKNFVYDDFCGANVSKYVMKEQKKSDDKILVFLKPCDTYSFNQLTAEHKIKRGNVYVIGISCEGKRARQVTARDYEDYDYLICMDHSNVRNLKRIIGSDPQGKVHLMMDFTDTPGEVSDPWYTGDFAKTYDDIWRGCQGLLARLNDE